MRFWDSSALVPLLVHEPRSDVVRMLIDSDSHIVASLLTPLEIVGALWRRRRSGELTAAEHTDADTAFAEISRVWSDVEEIQSVREIALDVLSRHPLRSSDAFQLASAIVAAEHKPSSLPFVTLDYDLASAARTEGFPVLP
jgi:predicted nucleic acid-binding protein